MKWALIGYGGMGSWHVDNLKTMPEIEIAGIYDIDPVRMAAARDAGLFTYESQEALLADPAVQVITIATPNDVHRPIAEAAMRAGKDVISEKPVTLSSMDLQAIFDTAKETGRMFTVHQNRRWDEDFLVVQKLIREGTLGRIFNIETRVHGSRGVPGDWRNRKRRGGGMILDWGVHMLDQILLLTDQDVVSTFCTISHVTNDEVDDGFKAIITFADGLTAHVETGTSNFVSLPRWYVQGENGTALMEDWHINGKIVMVSDWEKRDAVPVVTAAGLTKTMAPRTDDTIKTYPLPRIPSDVRDFYRNICQCVQGEATQLITHAQLMRVMRLMEAMFTSAELNQVVHTRI